MKTVKRILFEIFDFFCGDWFIFGGVAITAATVYGISHLAAFQFLKPVGAIIYIILLCATLVITLLKECRKDK